MNYFLIATLVFFNIFTSQSLESKESIVAIDESSIHAAPCYSFKNLSTCIVAPQYAISDLVLRRRLDSAFIKELEKIGKVIKISPKEAKSPRKSPNILKIDLIPVSTWNGKILPIIEASLAMEIPGGVANEGCLVYNWMRHTFIEGELEAANENNMTSSVVKLIREFVSDYRKNNKNNITFYWYN